MDRIYKGHYGRGLFSLSKRTKTYYSLIETMTETIHQAWTTRTATCLQILESKTQNYFVPQKYMLACSSLYCPRKKNSESKFRSHDVLDPKASFTRIFSQKVCLHFPSCFSILGYLNKDLQMIIS